MLSVGGEVNMKRQLFFRELRPDQDPLTVREEIREHSLTERQRFIVLTDYVRFYGYDTKLDEALDCDFTDLADHYDFFLPWAGIEKTRHHDENPADVKAAERMAKLFDIIKKENPDDSPEFVHDLNVFLSRVLFCFFAEDTGIFPGQNLFSNGIGSQTKTDGSDLKGYLTELFTVLDLASDHRTGGSSERSRRVRAHFLEFPYVNGGLFRDRIRVPDFSARSRRAIIDAGTLDWGDINPDIFGSMIQAVVTAEHRGGLGMHYTSVPNIMKVIEPLFLNDLRETFTKAHDGRYEKNDLKELRDRISKLKIFDPACGSGNFLIIAYKELRKLEMEVIQRMDDMGEDAGARLFDKGAGAVSTVSLNQFYGIEIDDFAHEIAILALWLTEHQMNAEFERIFGRSKPTLPLADAGHIVHANACRVDWEEVCPKVEGEETYILGNPPYLGARMQDENHKADMAVVFKGFKKYKDLDLIGAWFYQGAKYIKGVNARMAFVSTNSICQGEQVTLLWPPIFKLGVEIEFAHQSFKWINNAKYNAGVIVIIVGLANSKNSRSKWIYSTEKTEEVELINSYLVEGSDVIIRKRTNPLSNFARMSFGNMANDGGGLIFTQVEYDAFIREYPESKLFLRRYVGASEYIRGYNRYCLWVENDDLDAALSNEHIVERVEITRKHRLKSVDKGTNELAKRSHQFRDLNQAKESTIVIPRVSSFRRDYIPSGILGSEFIVSDNAQAIYDGSVYLLSVVSSRIHMTWLRAVAGRLKSDYRYSKGLVYNTFPFPPITPSQEQTLTETALGILAARELHPGSTLAELYDPNKMPENLREAHRTNDLAVEACYRTEPFTSDEERLAYLFKLYEEMIAAEEEKDTLFAIQKKAKKARKKKK
jgi:type I restriction-modification system DNA methylase subunit